MGASRSKRTYTPEAIFTLQVGIPRDSSLRLTASVFDALLDSSYEPYAWKNPDGTKAYVLVETLRCELRTTYNLRQFTIRSESEITESQMSAWERMAEQVAEAIINSTHLWARYVTLELDVVYSTTKLKLSAPRT